MAIKNDNLLKCLIGLVSLMIIVCFIFKLYMQQSVAIRIWQQKGVVISPSFWNSHEVVDSEALKSIAENDSKPQRGRNASKEDHEWEQMMEKRFSDRKDSLYEKCKNYNGSIPDIRTTFLYSPKHKIVTCYNRKGGATSWKTHFLRMNGYKKSIKNPHSPILAELIIATKLVGLSELRRIMHSDEEEFTRVISVRNPFARLVSAYVDKLFDGKRTPLKKHGLYNHRTALKLMGIPANHDGKVAVPFSVFLRSVVVENNDDEIITNVHWRPYSSNCNPCQLYYDYIVKMETFEEDIQYLFSKLKIEECEVKTRRNKKATTYRSTYEAYYKNVPYDIIAQVYSIFKQDFDLFGYDLPQFAKDALSKTETRNV